MMTRDVVNQKQNDFWLHELRIANYETVLEFRKTAVIYFLRPSFLNLSACSVVGNVCLDVVVVVQKSDFTSLLT